MVGETAARTGSTFFGGPGCTSATRGAGGAAPGAARLLRRAADARGRRTAWPTPTASARPCARSSSRWAPTAGSGIGWPKEYGGQGRGPVEQFIFFDESMRAGAPVPMLTINTVGPTIMELRHRGAEGLLPPEDPRRASSTSASATPSPTPAPTSPSLKTRAVRDGDEYVINGQKIFTSLASDADYCWLAVRTDPDAPKHKGISMFIVPDGHARASRSSRMQPAERRTTSTLFYDDVRVPATNLVGGENNGWTLITNQLNHERVTLCSPGMLEQTLRRRPPLGPGDQAARRPPGHRPGVGAAQPGPGARRARVPAPHQLEGGVGGDRRASRSTSADASTIKVFGTEFYLEAYRLLMEVARAGVLPAPRTRPSALLRSPPRAQLPQPHHPHLRRRRQRGAARPDRHVRPGPAPGRPITGGQHQPWTSPSPTSSRPSPTWPPRSSATSRPPSALKAHEARATRTRPGCGRRWPRPTCSASPCPRPTAAAASASSRPA